MHAPTLGRGFALACLISTLGLSGSTSAEPQSVPGQSAGVRKAVLAQQSRLGTVLLPPPTNDACTAPATIPSSGGFVNFNTTEATAQSAAPAQGQNSGCGPIGRDVWFSWTAPGVAGGTTGQVTIETCNLTTLDTVLAVYTGAACPGANAALVCNNDSCATQSSVSFTYTAGQAYLIQLGSVGLAAAGGTGQLSVCIRRNRSTVGSLLVFPEFDNTAASKTVYTISHTVADPAAHMRNVIVEAVYIDSADCREDVNRTFTLTPYDTVSFITSIQNPNATTGYIYAFAKNCTTGPIDSICPIVFNSLIGMETVINGITNFDYSINAISFRGIGAENALNDDGTRPGFRDLDDVNEYEGAPNQIFIPRFLGQDAAAVVTNNINSSIILLSLSTNQQILVQGTINSNNVGANPPFACSSFQSTFTCWSKRPLRDLTTLTLNTDLEMFAGNELIGFPNQPNRIRTGWITIDAAPDNAFYAVLVERAGAGGPQAAADLPFEFCSQGDGRLRPTQL